MLRRAAYLVPIFLVASLELNARPPVQTEAELQQAPAPGAPARAQGLELTGKVISKPGKPVVVAVVGKNPLDQPTTARIQVRVMERPASSPMARMVPMPRERAVRTVEVALGPHEQLDHRLRFANIKRPGVKRPRRKRNRLLRMSPARLFVQVSIVKDKPLARK